MPRLLVLTDRTQAAPRSLVSVLDAAVRGGARAVVVREKDLDRPERAGLVAALRPIVELLLVASDPALPGDGVHLASDDRMPEPRPEVVGRSCHDAYDVARAVTQRCDYLTVSPVFASTSKPGYGPTLGLDGLARLAADVTIPVYALGGITPRTAGACLEAGAHGVAVMGEIMRAGDPAATVAAYLAALSTPAGPR